MTLFPSSGGAMVNRTLESGLPLSRNQRTTMSNQASALQIFAAPTERYPDKANGTSIRSLRFCVWLTQIVFYALPWLSWNGRHAVLFDLVACKVYLFGLVLWPQELSCLSIVPLVCGLSLFLFTVLAGSAWRDIAPPLVAHMKIVMWTERKMERKRAVPRSQDLQPWWATETAYNAAKHTVYGTFALWTGLTFSGYFTAA